MIHQDCSFRPLQFATRFLLIFGFDRQRLETVKSALVASEWHAVAPQSNYRGDFLPSFLESVTGSTTDGRLYQLKVPSSQRKPGQRIRVRYRADEEVTAALWNQDGRDIELFLTNHGTGALSIALTLEECRLGEREIGLADIKTFNYRLAQQPLRRGVRGGAATITKADGDSYGATTLNELGIELLNCLRADASLGFQLLREGSLVPFSVIRFGASVQFQSLTPPDGLAPQDDLAAQASMIAQVFEARHSLATREDPGAVVRVFHSDELMATSEMGAAILISDLGTQYDKQKLQSRLDTYFLCFLAALLQRARLRLLLDDVGKVPVAPAGSDRDRLLEQLRADMVSTAARGDLLEVSTRDVHNRYLRLCQDAQRVPQALSLIQQTISDLDASLHAERQSKSLSQLNQTQLALHELASQQKALIESQSTVLSEQVKHSGFMASTQNKVEWIEIFLISFYSAELTELLGKGFQMDHHYLSWAVLAAMFGCGLIAAMLIKPWRHNEHDQGLLELPPRRFNLVLLAVGVVVAAFIWGGKQHVAPPEKDSAVLEELRRTRRHVEELTEAVKKASAPRSTLPEPPQGRDKERRQGR